jgi:hypothetical protein
LFIAEQQIKLGGVQPYRRNSANAGRNVESAGFVKLEHLKQQPHKTQAIDGIIRRDRVKNSEKATNICRLLLNLVRTFLGLLAKSILYSIEKMATRVENSFYAFTIGSC